MFNIRVYGADWCNPCCEVKELLNKLNLNYDFIDIEKNKDDKRALTFTAIPVIDFIDSNGNIVKSHVGAIGKTHLLKLLRDE